MDASKESIAILEKLPLLVCRLSPEGNIEYTNQYVTKATGYSPEELEGRNWWDIFYPNRYRWQVDKLFEELESGEVVDYEMVLLDKANNEHIIKWTSRTNRDEEGDIVNIMGLGLDVTEKVSAKAAAKRERLTFAKIMDISPIAIVIVESDGKISYANKEALELFGLDQDGITKRNFDSPEWGITTFDGEELPAEELPAARVMREKKPVFNVKHAIHQPDGERRFLSVNSAPFLNEKGEVEKVINTIQDVTEKEEAIQLSERTMRALRVTNEGLRAIMNSSDLEEILESICHIAINAGGYEIAWFGKAVNDERKSVVPLAVCGEHSSYVEDIDVTWDDSKLGHGPTGEAIRTMKPVASRDIEKDAKFSPWKEEALEKGFHSSMAIPFHLGPDTIATFNVYSSEKDAFDQKEVLLIEKLVESLEFALEANRQRIQYLETREDLEKVSAQAFLYLDVMGHDLRNQLQSVILSLDILAAEYPQIKDSVHIDTINMQLTRATRLIQKANTLNKVLNAEVQSETLNSYLEEAIAETQAKEPKAQIIYREPDSEITVKANEFLLTAFCDILENAVEHNPENPKKIWIDVEKDEEFCKVEIADNGQGVPDDLKGSLFDHKRRFGGLGLHLVANILDSYGGGIEVRNRFPRAPTEGALFSMKIPIAKESND